MIIPMGRILMPIPQYIPPPEAVQSTTSIEAVGNANFIGILAILLALYFGLNYGKRR